MSSSGASHSGSTLTPTAKSANYNAASGDFVEMTGAHTVSLPIPTSAYVVGIESVNGSGTSPCTVSSVANGGVILGKGVAASANTILLGTPGAFVILYSDGTNWTIGAGCQDSGWITPGAFTNSWVNGSPPVQYRLIENRMVFQGQMAGGTGGATAFTLPAGYRPTIGQIYPTLKYNAGAPQTDSATVTTAGLFQPNATDATAYYPVGCTYTVD